jgi:hypothetical protein
MTELCTMNTQNHSDVSKSVQFTLYTYTTLMGKHGTIILSEYASKKLEKLIEQNKLVEMESFDKCTFSLGELLTKGIIINGCSDLIDSLQITLPDNKYTDEKPKINGKFLHGSRKELFRDLSDVDFTYEPESEVEEVEEDPAIHMDMNWLLQDQNE